MVNGSVSISGDGTMAIAGDVFEYRLVARADKSVTAAAARERDELFGLFGGADEAGWKPELVIASYQARDAMEPILARWMQNLCSLQPSFPVTLNNFAGLPYSIFLRVQDLQPFPGLSRQLQQLSPFLESSGFPPLLVHRRPGLVIAEGLPPAVYDAAIRYYSCKTFHESFLVRELHLLRCKAQEAFTVNIFGLLPASALPGAA